MLVGSRLDRSLTILDTDSARTVVRLRLPVEPANFCFNSDGGQLFVTGPGMDAVAIVFPYETEVGETILAGRAPDGMAVTAAPPYLFVANPESGSITVLDIDTRKLVAQVAVGQEPRRILITPDNQYALVLNRRSGDMAVVWIRALTARRHRTDPAPLVHHDSGRGAAGGRGGGGSGVRGGGETTGLVAERARGRMGERAIPASPSSCDLMHSRFANRECRIEVIVLKPAPAISKMIRYRVFAPLKISSSSYKRPRPRPCPSTRQETR